MGRSLTHKKALDAILFGDSNGGGTGGGDKVSTVPIVYIETVTIDPQGMHTVTFTPSSLASKSKILGILDYSVLDANGDTLQLSLVSAKLTSDEKSVEAVFFNAMLTHLDAATFIASLLVTEPGSGGGGSGIEIIKVENKELPVNPEDNSVNIPAQAYSITFNQFGLRALNVNGMQSYSLGINKTAEGISFNSYDVAERVNRWDIVLPDTTYVNGRAPSIQTQGDWRYKIYSDGTFEAWYFVSGQTITIGDTSGAVYRSAPMSLTLPSNLVSNKTVIPHSCSVNVGHRSYPVWGTIASVSGANLTYYALSGSTRTATGNHTISAYVTGALE